MKIKSHRIIIGRGNPKDLVAKQEGKTGDCYGHWSGFSLLGLTVAIHVNKKGPDALEA
jgi:hypothetical protein